MTEFGCDDDTKDVSCEGEERISARVVVVVVVAVVVVI